MEVMGDLRRGPEGELPVGAVARDRRMRLDGGVRVPLEKEPILTDVVRGGEARVEVAEGKMDLLEDVRALGRVVDLHVLALERLLDREDRLEVLVIDLDERERVERAVLVDRRDGGDRLADVADLVDR